MAAAGILTRRFFIVLMAFFMFSAGALAGESGDKPFQPSDDVMADVDAVLERAREGGKLALIIMGANWCHDSMGLYGHFKDPALAATLDDNYEKLLVDVGYLERGEEVIQRFGQPVIYGTPTVLIIDPETEELLNRESMHRLRDSASMGIDEAREYFANTAARSVVSITCTASTGSPARFRPAAMQRAIARLERMASDPPRRIVALPALRHRPAASAVTLGRDS